LVMVRLRDCAPVPHDLVQVVHALKALVAQWIGHGPLPQERVVMLAGHALPPCMGAVRLRVRCWEPPPQDLVHAVYGPSKFGTTQSTGHAWVLQSCEPVRSVGQA